MATSDYDVRPDKTQNEEDKRQDEATNAPAAAAAEELGSPGNQSPTASGAGAAGRESHVRRQSSILGSMTSQIVGDQVVAESETQPLLRNQPGTREGNREQVRRNERSVARQLLERYACPLCICVCIFFLWAIAAFAFYFIGWWIWWHYGHDKCDQPLGFWLLLQLLVATAATLSSVCPHGLRIVMRFLPWVSLSLGIYWLFISKTCAKTSPELYNFVRLYIIFLAVTYIAWVTLTVIIVSLLIYAAMNGWLGQQSGAKPETIGKIETWTYDPSVFCDADNPSDGRPPNECCVCSESYSADVPMKRTPCHHYFHTDCLEKWLKVAKTCPLCRMDLEEAIEDVEQPAET